MLKAVDVDLVVAHAVVVDVQHNFTVQNEANVAPLIQWKRDVKWSKK